MNVAFNFLEARDEFINGTTERVLGIDLQKAREIYQWEQQITELFFDAFRFIGLDDLLEFIQFFMNFLPDRFCVIPVKANLRGLLLQAMRPN